MAQTAHNTSAIDGQPQPVPGGMTIESLWESLTGEPLTGVAIVTIKGDVRYVNDQAVSILFGSGAKSGEYLGKNVRDYLPAEWVRERLKVLQQVLTTGKPVALRSIWRGHQQIAWIRYIDPEESESGEDGACESPAQFLCIIRRVPGDEAVGEMVDESKFEFVESQMIELGPLDVLTPRELEVLALIGQGLSLKEIASALYRTVKTVEKHRAAIGMKLAAHDRVKFAEIANRAGLTTRDAARERV